MKTLFPHRNVKLRCAHRITLAFALACGLPAWSAPLESTSPTAGVSNAPPPKQEGTAPRRIRLPTQSDDVLRLVKAKVDQEVVIAFVRNSAIAYNLTAGEIVSLKDQGVSSGIILAMIQRGAEMRAQYRQAAQANPAYAAPSTATPPLAATAPEPTAAPQVVYTTQPVYQEYPVTYPAYTYSDPAYSYWWYNYGYPYSWASYWYWPSYGYCGYHGYYHNRWNCSEKCYWRGDYPSQYRQAGYDRNRGYPDRRGGPGNVNPGRSGPRQGVSPVYRGGRPLPARNVAPGTTYAGFRGGRGAMPANTSFSSRPGGSGTAMRAYSLASPRNLTFRPMGGGTSMRSFSAPTIGRVGFRASPGGSNMRSFTGGGFRGGGMSAGRSMGRGR